MERDCCDTLIRLYMVGSKLFMERKTKLLMEHGMKLLLGRGKEIVPGMRNMAMFIFLVAKAVVHHFFVNIKS